MKKYDNLTDKEKEIYDIADATAKAANATVDAVYGGDACAVATVAAYNAVYSANKIKNLLLGD